MENNSFRKASNYFNTKYGDDYNDASKIFDFGWSCLPRSIQYSDLSSDAKICLAVMIDLKHNSNSPNPQLYYPSQKRIGFLTGLSVSSVSRALKELNDTELIGKMRVGQGKQNIYCLLNPPEKFVLNAIRRRVIIEEIRQGRNDWMDFDDKGNVIIENEVERKEAQDRINALICKYANLQNQPCKSAFPNQAYRNAPDTAPTLDIDDSELSSVELSSEEASSDSGSTSNQGGEQGKNDAAFEITKKSNQPNPDSSSSFSPGLKANNGKVTLPHSPSRNNYAEGPATTVVNSPPPSTVPSAFRLPPSDSPPAEMCLSVGLVNASTNRGIDEYKGQNMVGSEYMLAVDEKMARLKICAALSAADSPVVSQMEKEGVPLKLVLATMDEVFERNAKSKKSKKIRSFSYFVPAIEEAFKGRAQPRDREKEYAATRQLIERLK